ncbi:MAG: hypothetical protein KA099_07955 [Alphaproteobacteria bacterium]|jgi:hypothetical protein|nr:hypothetical protein [Alphaproteobacteria bacterium]MBK9585492.1 hypothetical protein [Alphaproteobacteria bacterium]MBP7760019.1 hypothetical protein [Alphaproteobacteria bacterium]MBP7763219.1 hypothetical protein [Alphaproteobacteria bacterium]MBP7905243.1 hypothetical protein [Alphaproteobacteria bacterium]
MSDTQIDLQTMGRLANALSFIISPDNPAVVAMRAAVESGSAKDIKHARTLFLRVNATHRNAALAMLMDGD